MQPNIQRRICFHGTSICITSVVSYPLALWSYLKLNLTQYDNSIFSHPFIGVFHCIWGTGIHHGLLVPTETQRFQYRHAEKGQSYRTVPKTCRSSTRFSKTVRSQQTRQTEAHHDRSYFLQPRIKSHDVSATFFFVLKET